MLLCHCITSLRNKQITVAKSAIELNLANAEASVTGINMLSSMGLRVMYQIVYNNLQKIETEHKRSVHKYFSHNQLFVLNINDYHDLHESCQPNAISLSRIAHMATLLINTSSNIAPISFFSINNYSVHNPNEVFGKKRNLAAKPKPWKINLLLYLANTEWNLVKDLIFLRFTQSKNVGYRTFIDLLDNLIPSTLDVYSNLFRGNHFEGIS
ncbi:hypothetical protein RhiirC2_841516 [Rhizophagus irregularis]|uniref:Uncharacterized protein n=1 Tax=Rhizophagus irregularis TaxID=588596 RepID=A0A2N1P3H6_9GLOM|nr:hypothetical protein RhiirC2_841516 [Rhizophagus irregularis]